MIEIKHRDTNAVLATVETLSGADLSRANLSRANLIGADLRWANLSGADLTGAYLSGADLRWANLSGADLSGTDLTGAIMGEDKLDSLLARATRLDGYEFFLFALEDGSSKIKASCRWMSVADYRAHVAMDYPDTDKARETLRILDYFDACSAALTEPAIEIVRGAA